MTSQEIVEKFIDPEEELETGDPKQFGSRIWNGSGVRIGDQIGRDGDTLTVLGGCGRPKWPGVIRYHDSRTGLGQAWCSLRTWAKWSGK